MTIELIYNQTLGIYVFLGITDYQSVPVPIVPMTCPPLWTPERGTVYVSRVWRRTPTITYPGPCPHDTRVSATLLGCTVSLPSPSSSPLTSTSSSLPVSPRDCHTNHPSTFLVNLSLGRYITSVPVMMSLWTHGFEFRRCSFQRYVDDSQFQRRMCDRDSPGSLDP